MLVILIYSLSLRSKPDGILLLMAPRAERAKKKNKKTVVHLVKDAPESSPDPAGVNVAPREGCKTLL